MTKEQIADLAQRLAIVAGDICSQLNGAKVSHKQKYFLGLLSRQHVILNDIAKVLLERTIHAQHSTYILFRCLLDDFITVLYFQTKEMDENAILSHAAQAFKKRLKMYAESNKINHKYFGGTMTQLATDDSFEKETEEFYNEPSNAVYFKNPKKREWKTFPTTTDIVRQLPINGISAANAHALLLWSFLSNYVHYSSLTYMLDRNTDGKEIEIAQLQEVLSYVYKTIFMASEALKKFGLDNTLNDTTNVLEEIMPKYKSLEDFEPI